MSDRNPLTIGYDTNNNANKLIEVLFSSVDLDDVANVAPAQGQVLVFSSGIYAPSTLILGGGGTPFSCNDLSACDHGILAGLGDDDHTQYVLSDGTRPMAALVVDNALRAGSVSSLSISGVALNATTASALNLHATNLGASTIVLTALNAPTVAATTSVSSASVSAVNLNATNASALNLTATNLHVPGNIAVTGTVDGVDIASRDGVLTAVVDVAVAALPKAGGTMTGALNGTVLNATTSVSSASVSAVNLNATTASALNLTVSTANVSNLTVGSIPTANTVDNDGSIATSLGVQRIPHVHGQFIWTRFKTAGTQSSAGNLTTLGNGITTTSDIEIVKSIPDGAAAGDDTLMSYTYATGDGGTAKWNVGDSQGIYKINLNAIMYNSGSNTDTNINIKVNGSAVGGAEDLFITAGSYIAHQSRPASFEWVGLIRSSWDITIDATSTTGNTNFLTGTTVSITRIA